jgi:hypothetical protein
MYVYTLPCPASCFSIVVSIHLLLFFLNFPMLNEHELIPGHLNVSIRPVEITHTHNALKNI